jgi:hypothetical protein
VLSVNGLNTPPIFVLLFLASTNIYCTPCFIKSINPVAVSDISVVKQTAHPISCRSEIHKHNHNLQININASLILFCCDLISTALGSVDSLCHHLSLQEYIRLVLKLVLKFSIYKLNVFLYFLCRLYP